MRPITYALQFRGVANEAGPGVLTARATAPGHLTLSLDRNLRHDSAVSKIHGGRGQFDGASGRITSNFFLSDTGELTDNQLGLVFISPAD